MRVRLMAVCVVSAGVLVSTGCAHNGTSADTSSAPKEAPIRPPKILPGPPMRITSPGRVDATVSVLVRADGTPDMSTFRVTGLVSQSTWADLRSWIAQSLFEPARQAGIPVPATAKMELRSQ